MSPLSASGAVTFAPGEDEPKAGGPGGRAGDKATGRRAKAKAKQSRPKSEAKGGGVGMAGSEGGLASSGRSLASLEASLSLDSSSLASSYAGGAEGGVASTRGGGGGSNRRRGAGPLQGRDELSVGGGRDDTSVAHALKAMGSSGLGHAKAAQVLGTRSLGRSLGASLFHRCFLLSIFPAYLEANMSLNHPHARAYAYTPS